MKPKTMILMVIAIVCGLGASYMTSRLLAERNTEPQEIPKVSVVVAKQQLNVGQPVKKLDELFEMKEFSKGDEPKDALTSLDQIKGKYMKRNLRKGDFVRPMDIAETVTSIDLPPGHVALGVKVPPEDMAAGFAAEPGQRIDILWTTKGITGNQGPQSITLLQNVLVVAADLQSTSMQSDDKKPFLANVITVAVSKEDAQKVKLASEFGKLSLTVQKIDDEPSPNKAPKVTTLIDLLPSAPENKDPAAKSDGSTQPPTTAMIDPKQERPQDKKIDPQPSNPAPKDPPNNGGQPKANPTPQPSPQPQPVAKAPETNKREHLVYLKKGNEVHIQKFWIYDDGTILQDGYTPEGVKHKQFVPAPKEKEENSSGPNGAASTPNGGSGPAVDSNNQNQDASQPAPGASGTKKD